MSNAQDEQHYGDEMIAGRRGDALGGMPADMPSWMAKTIVGIDTLSLWIGRTVRWLALPLMLAMVYEIVVRYAFTAPTIWAYDLSRMLYGALFILGAGYALSKGVHIRSDFLYRDWPVKWQGRVDAALYLIFYFPAMIVFLWVATEWAYTAVIREERGMDTAWMPFLGPIKSALPVGVLFLLIQGVSEFLKSVYAATRGRWPEQ
ncbi:MAG TPA: TRAP transporter small permease subunit [Pelomicrobium sp.]|nr:TRAP transporter small permease subunit [Pelomicrobium sp.]